MTDDDVLAFFAWNDAEARIAINDARIHARWEYLARMAEDMRDTLGGDVVAEIRRRKAVANENA